jgi:hypothetical protein
VERSAHRPPQQHTADRSSDHDAQALVQVTALDRQAREEGSNVLYVLVTADQVLIDVYAHWFWSRSSLERGDDRFVVRDILQYVPILNVQDMPNGVIRSDVIERARDALDGLFLNVPGIDENCPPELLYYKLGIRFSAIGSPSEGANSGIAFDDRAMDAFRKIRAIWSENFRNGVVLNTALIQRRLKTEFDHLAKLLQEDRDLLAALHDEQRRTLSEVFAVHAAITTRTNIRALITSNAAAHIERHSRLFLRKRFTQLIGDLPLETVLDSLASGNHGIAEAIERNLDGAERLEEVFFAACIAHRCSRWPTARLYATWALENLTKAVAHDADRMDLAYLHASIARLEFVSANAVIDAFTELRDMYRLAETQEDPFALARAICEQCSLVLSVLLRWRLLNDKRAREITHSLSVSGGALGPLALGALGKCKALASENAEMSIQAARNLVRAYVYARFIAPIEERPSLSFEIENVKAAMTDAISILRGKSSTIPESIELVAAQFGTGEVGPDCARKSIATLLAQRAPDHPAWAKLDDVEVDRLCALLAV